MITDHINRQLEQLLIRHQIIRAEQVLYGTNIPKPTRVIPTPWHTFIRYDCIASYFFYFDRAGITIYTLDGERCVQIPWTQVVRFRLWFPLLAGKMTIKTDTGTLKFQVNRRLVGCPWSARHARYLKENRFFCPYPNGKRPAG